MYIMMPIVVLQIKLAYYLYKKSYKTLIHKHKKSLLKPQPIVQFRPYHQHELL